MFLGVFAWQPKVGVVEAGFVAQGESGTESIHGVTGIEMVWGILSQWQAAAMLYKIPAFVPGQKLRQESSSCVTPPECCTISVLGAHRGWGREVKQAVLLPPHHCLIFASQVSSRVFVVGECRKDQKNATLHWDSQYQFWNLYILQVNAIISALLKAIREEQSCFQTLPFVDDYDTCNTQ